MSIPKNHRHKKWFFPYFDTKRKSLHLHASNRRHIIVVACTLNTNTNHFWVVPRKIQHNMLIPGYHEQIVMNAIWTYEHDEILQRTYLSDYGWFICKIRETFSTDLTMMVCLATKLTFATFWWKQSFSTNYQTTSKKWQCFGKVYMIYFDYYYNDLIAWEWKCHKWMMFYDVIRKQSWVVVM